MWDLVSWFIYFMITLSKDGHRAVYFGSTVGKDGGGHRSHGKYEKSVGYAEQALQTHASCAVNAVHNRLRWAFSRAVHTLMKCSRVRLRLRVSHRLSDRLAHFAASIQQNPCCFRATNSRPPTVEKKRVSWISTSIPSCGTHDARDESTPMP